MTDRDPPISAPSGKEHMAFLGRSGAVRWLWILFIVILVITVLVEAAVHMHGAFPLTDIFGFHAAYGFLACAAIVIFAKILGMPLKRKDTYYDPQGGDG